MVIGQKIYQIKTSSDSIKWAKDNIEHAPDGSIFLAETLTQARGRQGREWTFAPGQIAMTILLKPESLKSIPSQDVPLRLNQLNMALSLGILEPLKKYGVGLKWPNDFIVQDKKVGGMLLEAVWQGTELKGIILGFAVNVTNFFEETDPLYPIAISLQTAMGEPVDKSALEKELVVCLDKWYGVWSSGGFDHVYEQWSQHQAYVNKSISVHNKNGTLVEGVFLRVLPNGDLVLKDKRGTESTLSFYTVDVVSLTS